MTLLLETRRAGAWPQPRIALVMIVRNEAASIARCLCSVRELVDEMIVLDTGSTDATMAIARDNGALVYQWAWQDDFAAARNMALSHSTADWHLVLDADEWLVGDGLLLRQAAEQALAHQQSFVGLLPVHSQLDAAPPVDTAAAELQTLVSWIPRFLPRGVQYAGRVHEQPVSELARRRLTVAIDHDGYRWQKMDQKKGRNRRLLLEAVAVDSENPYLLYQLGKDYDIYAEPALALDCYEKALQQVSPVQSYRTDLVVRTVVCLTRTGAFELGYQFAEGEMEACRQSPDFFYVLAELLHGLANQQPEKSLSQWLPLARVSLLFCLKLGDTPDTVGSVHGRGSHLASAALNQLDKILLPAA